MKFEHKKLFEKTDFGRIVGFWWRIVTYCAAKQK